MKPVIAAIAYNPAPYFERILQSLARSPLVEGVVVVAGEQVDLPLAAGEDLLRGSLYSGEMLDSLLDRAKTDYLLLLPRASDLSFEPHGLERLVRTAETSGAGLVYSDFYTMTGGGRALHPLNDYQGGSVRDSFDFGALMLFSVPAARKARQEHGRLGPIKSAGLYDLRLKVSVTSPIVHLPEALYSVSSEEEGGFREGMFSYVDPRNAPAQKEMEDAFTRYLKSIGAYVPAGLLKERRPQPGTFPVEASVVIPVLNRAQTIADAVQSALSQAANFPFNVIVVDNHSTDGTAAVLSDLARRYPTLKHIGPERSDLAIGGCWNEALYSEACGRYAVQLDSDDLYAEADALQRLVDMLRQGRYAMVIGSYTLVDSSLREIAPGLVNHREWSDENGHNNALRVNGLGAPRAYDTALMRAIGFLNVSYGEDYTAALRICGEYRVGRIYESLYLCRRWTDNTDSGLSLAASNRNDAFKDLVRTDEIRRRQTFLREA